MQVRVLAFFAACSLALSAQAATELVVVTVNNGHMITMQKMTPFFEKANPDIKVRWVTLDEDVLRQRVAADIASKGGEFDVMTIGMYETPIWAKKGWLDEIRPDAAFDVKDLLPAIRTGLSYQGRLYASPFYGESSMTMYRSDLVGRTGPEMPSQPTWEQVRSIAAAVNDPAKGIHGICLRGKPGWGDNMALVGTMVNAFGGQWFSMDWHPQIDTPAWRTAVTFYIDLLKKYGPANAADNSFNENLKLFNEGKCGIWIDATIAASFVSDPAQSKVAAQAAFSQAPTAVTSKGANWLWAWALAVPAGSSKADQAQRFIRWATSKEYVQLVGNQVGWQQVPTGTRVSTYVNPHFISGARWAMAEAGAIAMADPTGSTLPRSPYVGVQIVSIPEFQAIGQFTGEQITRALRGQQTVEAALQSSQAFADREMRKGGYYK